MADRIQSIPSVVIGAACSPLAAFAHAQEASGNALSIGTFAGGLLITAYGLTEDRARAIGDDDPAVRSAVIEAIVRPWLTTIDVDHEVGPAPTTSG